MGSIVARLIEEWMGNPVGTQICVNYAVARRLAEQGIIKVDENEFKDWNKKVRVKFLSEWMGWEKGTVISMVVDKALELEKRKTVKILEEEDKEENISIGFQREEKDVKAPVKDKMIKSAPKQKVA